MLNYIELTNFKSFNYIKFDLRERDGSPKKLAVIYGENGAGKSNLISSVLFICKTMRTMKNVENISKFNENNFLTKLDEETKDMFFNSFIKNSLYTLLDLIKENRTIQSSENMAVTIGFQIDGKNGEYSLEFNEDSVVKEELRYFIKERMGKLFSLKTNEFILSPSIFKDSNYNKELHDILRKFWGKHTFMSILAKEEQDKNEDFMKDVIEKPFWDVTQFFHRLSIHCKDGAHSNKGRLSLTNAIFTDLESGETEENDLPKLKATESILNTFYTALYSDVKQVYYQLIINEKVKYNLYFKKMIGGKIIDIPFSLESTGTQKLLEILPFMISAGIGEVSLVDEIDSGIHDALICELFDHLDNSINGQFITTTHNTLLMKKIPPEYCYIISIDSNGNKAIRNVKDYNFRTQKTNNVQNKYLNGDYDGVPNIGYLDFEEIFQDFFDELTDKNQED